jgi:hypothetical protein
MTIRRRPGRFALLVLAAAAGLAMGAATSLLGACGPFADTVNDAFCRFVLEIFTLEITTGTTPTTYSPGDTVSRLQMAAFLSRTVDRALLRGSRRAALEQFWTPNAASSLRRTALGSSPRFVKSDGEDLWVSDAADETVSRVHASDGRLVEVWTGATNATGLVVAVGQVFAAGNVSPGNLYEIDPSQAAGAVTTVSTALGANPRTLAFDGIKIWSANQSGSVSFAFPGAIPWAVSTVTTGFNQLEGILYDGANIWVTDDGAGTLLKLNSAGGILQTVTVGTAPQSPAFDGNNIWVPNLTSNSVTVVRASSGAVLATLTGNGLSSLHVAAFDGQRVLVTSGTGAISLWKAADLSPLGFLDTGAGTQPYGACSDGHHFWVVLNDVDSLVRF